MHFNLYQVAIILLVVPPVAAQEALGRGDALDSSTSVLGKVNSPTTKSGVPTSCMAVVLMKELVVQAIVRCG